MTDLTTRISMSLPPGLLEAFDRVSHQSGYADRSKALQAAMRAFISDNTLFAPRPHRRSALSMCVAGPRESARHCELGGRPEAREGNHASQVIVPRDRIHLDGNSRSQRPVALPEVSAFLPCSFLLPEPFSSNTTL